MEIENKISKYWIKLFKYYKNNLLNSCQGVSEKELEKAELELGVKFPKEFSDSFRACNNRYIFDNTEIGWFGKHDHYSIGNTYCDYYNLVNINKEMRTYNEEWNKNWIAFYDYETWFYAILDTKTQKVYCYNYDKKVLWANSYEEWLEMAVNEVLEYGKIRLKTIERLMGISSE